MKKTITLNNFGYDLYKKGIYQILEHNQSKIKVEANLKIRDNNIFELSEYQYTQQQYLEKYKKLSNLASPVVADSSAYDLNNHINTLKMGIVSNGKLINQTQTIIDISNTQISCYKKISEVGNIQYLTAIDKILSEFKTSPPSNQENENIVNNLNCITEQYQPTCEKPVLAPESTPFVDNAQLNLTTSQTSPEGPKCLKISNPKELYSQIIKHIKYLSDTYYKDALFQDIYSSSLTSRQVINEKIGLSTYKECNIYNNSYLIELFYAISNCNYHEIVSLAAKITLDYAQYNHEWDFSTLDISSPELINNKILDKQTKLLLILKEGGKISKQKKLNSLVLDYQEFNDELFFFIIYLYLKEIINE